MARTWQQHLDAEDRLWHICVRIEGVGPVQWVTQLDATGRYAFCVAPPLYSPTSVLWLPLMTELPGVLSERASPLGGWPEAGNLTLSLLDRDDLLTDVMGSTERPPVGRLTTDVSATEQEWVLGTGQGAQFAYGQCFWCDGEALRIIDVSGDTLTVIRGWMGTDAVEHTGNTPIYARTPYVVGRRVELFMGPQDGSNASEQLIGQYVCDSVQWDPTTGVWQLQARSQLKYLDRIIPGNAPRTISIPGVRWFTDPQPWPDGGYNPGFPVRPIWGDYAHARNLDTGEIVRMSFTGQVVGRALVGTQEMEAEAGQQMEQVFAASELDFRFSSPAVSDRDDPDEWIPSAHFVDLLLNVLTSAASYSDGRELTNYDATTDINWSCLLPGFGLGVPASEIDFASFLDVKNRTPGWDFGWYVLGGGKTAREVLTELLVVTGCFLSTATSRLSLVLPRMPLIAEDVPTIDEDKIIRTPDRGLPLDGAMQVSLDSAASSVRYTLGPNAVPLDIRSADFEATFGQRMVYSRETAPVVIAAASIAPGAGGWLAGIAGGRLLRWRLPRLELTRVVDWSLYPDSAPGAIVAVTAPEVPDFGAGTRGADERPFVVIEREPRIEDGGMLLRMHAWGSGIRAARISPSAYVSAGTPDSGPPAITTLTVTAGRYAAGDNAALFQAGDKVALINRDGSLDTAGLTVLSVSANTIVVDDALAGKADKIVVYDDWSDLTERQRTRYAAYADSGTQMIEGVGAAFVHGER